MLVYVNASEPESEAWRTACADVEALTLALEKLGVTVREEALPERSRGGLLRLGTQRLCFVPRDGGPEQKRMALVDALRRLPTDEHFLHPRVRALLSE